MSLTDERAEVALDREHAGRPEPVSYQDLDEWMVGDEDDLTEPDAGDLVQVERLLRALAYRERELDRAQTFVAAEKERLDEWLAGQRRRLSPDALRQLLTSYHRARLAEDPRAKTITLPSGKLTARAGQPRWSIDQAVFVPWALEHAPGLVRTTTSPALAEAKKALAVADGGAVTEDGAPVPGVTVEPAEVAFSVKAGEA